MTETHTLKELMEDLQLQTEIHDKDKLKKRRENAKKEKTELNERKLKRRKPRKEIESEEERRIRRYGVPIEDGSN